MSESNIALVKTLYEAHGRGAFDEVVAGMTQDVEWHSGGLQEDHPLFGPREGRESVLAFFRQTFELFAFSEFTPREFYADRDKVFVLGTYALKVKRTGRDFASDWVHIFTLREGRVARFREMTDTARLVAANRVEHAVPERALAL
jgi:ketosteroid isomerase-like protein